MRKRLTAEAIRNLEDRVSASTGERHSTVFGVVSTTGDLLRKIEYVGGEWALSDRPATIYTAEKLERAVTSNKRFVIVYGGRGSMKSVGVVDIMLSGVMDRGDKVYCLREYQESIAESVHSLNKEEIKRIGLEGFTVQDSAIYHKGGGELKYRGLARNPASVKSAAGFRRFFVEEAATLSEESIKNLTPTARNKAKFGLPGDIVENEDDELAGVQMFFVANPNSSEDPFSKRFINPFVDVLNKQGWYEDDLHLIVKMNYTDNPWFDLSGLEQERLFDYENKPRAVYDHVWLGAFLDTVNNAIIEAEWFDACIDAHVQLGFEPLGQEKVAYDPADSGDAKAVAYQHGSVVLGCASIDHGDINTATDWALSKTADIRPDVFMWDADGAGLSLRRQVHEGLNGKKIQLVEFHGSGEKYDQDEIYEEIEGESWGDKPKTNADMFTNLRAQCYWALRDRIFKTYLAVKKGRYYPRDELISFSSGIKELAALRAEVCRIPRKYVASSRIQIMSKQEMKGIKLKSPNLADAVMMLQKPVDPFQAYDDDYEHDNTPEGWA